MTLPAKYANGTLTPMFSRYPNTVTKSGSSLTGTIPHETVEVYKVTP